jgi:hypothetical protein
VSRAWFLDRLSSVAIVTELFLDERLQALVGVGDGHLGGIGGTSYGSGGDSGNDSVGTNLGCHGDGCNCATVRTARR